MWIPSIRFRNGSPWDELDRDGSGKVGRDELADFYSTQVAGQRYRGTRTAAGNGGEITDALLRRFWTPTATGTSMHREWKAAAETLHSLDRNDDELIGPGELVAYASIRRYGKRVADGRIGTSTTRRATKPTCRSSSCLAVEPIQAGPRSSSSAGIGTATRALHGNRSRFGARRILISRSRCRWQVDGGGTGSLAQDAARRQLARPVLKSRRRDAAHLESLSGPANNALGHDHLELITPPLAVDIRVDAGRLPAAVVESRKQFNDHFDEANVNRDGFLDQADWGIRIPCASST